MLRIGITGQAGFIGTHLFNKLALLKDRFVPIPFEDDFFSDQEKLQDFVKQCEVIVHLAAVNRHNNPEILYQTNIRLVKQVIEACEATNSKPHILFSSSIQEERDNIYGISKKESQLLFRNWAEKNSIHYTGLVIPNVFGPFGMPYYNSVVATFCHQLTHNETPKVDIDGEIKLIYVGELIDEIIKRISYKDGSEFLESIYINHTKEIKVSSLLEKLNSFKDNYFEKGIIPDLNDRFDLNLFNTFLCYIDHASFFPLRLKSNSDLRGSFTEIIKLNSRGQVSFSTTVPGITRGNHFHTRKTERFAVIKGKARIKLRRIGTNQSLEFELCGNQPSCVDMPVWFTHNITNIGDEELFTLFWINEHYNPNDPDTFFETV